MPCERNLANNLPTSNSLILLQIVPRASAVLSWPNEKRALIDADHKQMVKFDHVESEKFDPVWKRILFLIDSVDSGNHCQSEKVVGGDQHLFNHETEGMEISVGAPKGEVHSDQKEYESQSSDKDNRALGMLEEPAGSTFSATKQAVKAGDFPLNSLDLKICSSCFLWRMVTMIMELL